MKVAVAGGSGFIGTAVVEHLVRQGHDVAVLTRNPPKVDVGRPLQWDGKTQGAWSGDVATADLVINLAGENIGARRWTDERKRRLVDSRIDSTRALVEAMRSRPDRKRIFISVSGVNYYGARGDEELDEDSPPGGGFAAELTQRWEAEARAAEPVARTAILRFGVVIGPGGGVLDRMMLPFKLGLGGRVGSGRQWFSWVALEDVIRMIDWVIAHADAQGLYNVTSPRPVRHHEFTSALGRALRRPTIFPAPAFALKLMFGQLAEELLLTGQRVVPSRAMRSGFRFNVDSIDDALQVAVASR